MMQLMKQALQMTEQVSEKKPWNIFSSLHGNFKIVRHTQTGRASVFASVDPVHFHFRRSHILIRMSTALQKKKGISEEN